MTAAALVVDERDLNLLNSAPPTDGLKEKLRLSVESARPDRVKWQLWKTVEAKTTLAVQDLHAADQGDEETRQPIADER